MTIHPATIAGNYKKEEGAMLKVRFFVNEPSGKT
jgi:hypothetical protein